jgi:hypothetical protein
MCVISAMNKDIANGRTRELELDHPPPAPQIVFILVSLPQSRAILFMLLIFSPMLFRAVCRPTAVRALECNVLRLCMYVRVRMRVRRETHRARRELFDRFAATLDGGEGRLGERVEEVVFTQDGLWVLRLAVLDGLAPEEVEECAPLILRGERAVERDGRPTRRDAGSGDKAS